MRIVLISEDRLAEMILANRRRVNIISFFPHDPHDCVCQDDIKKLRRELALMKSVDAQAYFEKNGRYECPRAKESGMNLYNVVCGVCGEVQGFVRSRDKSLVDFADFHYIQWHDRKGWHGCFTPHISPIDGRLCFECICGNDTRDFRANMTLPAKMVNEIEVENSIGREFNKSESKFLVQAYG